MATKFLPVTGVELPSDEFEMRNYQQNLAFSEETLCFKAVIVHLPTKAKMFVENDGHGGANMTFWDDSAKVSEASAAWNKFLDDCVPALQASVADSEYDWVRDLYNDGNASEDCVIGLFTNELSNQKMLSGKRGTVVRKNPADDAYMVYKATPEQLAGRVAGEYWDKKAKNWVAL